MFGEFLVVLMVLLNFRLMGVSRFGACVQTVAIQALVISALAFLSQNELSFWTIILVVAATALKAGVLPHGARTMRGPAWCWKLILRSVTPSRC